jgi:hypothetical protein
MDWMIVCGIVIGAWMMLSVLSGERANRVNQLAQTAVNKAAAEKAAHQQ